MLIALPLQVRKISNPTSIRIARIAQHILDNQLHILVYLDIGMDARTTQLAGLRLAPVQCVTWGHPITSF